MLYKNHITGKCLRNGTEILPEDYEAAIAELREKAALVLALHKNEIHISAVPSEWQEEIRRRADAMAAADAEDTDLTADEALDIILGGVS